MHRYGLQNNVHVLPKCYKCFTNIFDYYRYLLQNDVQVLAKCYKGLTKIFNYYLQVQCGLHICRCLHIVDDQSTVTAVDFS